MESSKAIHQPTLLGASEIVTASDDVLVVEKGWGEERWLFNTELYCAKILVMHKGKRLSWHFHKLKDETFTLISGRVQIVYGESEDYEAAQTRVLNPGDRFHVPPGLLHQLISDENSEILEVSTPHMESDSYRVIKGD